MRLGPTPGMLSASRFWTEIRGRVVAPASCNGLVEMGVNVRDLSACIIWCFGRGKFWGYYNCFIVFFFKF